jgi:hypothetical protein
VRVHARRRVVAADVQKLVEGGGKAPAAEPSQAAPAPVRPGVRGMPARVSVACTHQVGALQWRLAAACAPGLRPACRRGSEPDVRTAHVCSRAVSETWELRVSAEYAGRAATRGAGSPLRTG